jgi:hypothetical protein
MPNISQLWPQNNVLSHTLPVIPQIKLSTENENERSESVYLATVLLSISNQPVVQEKKPTQQSAGCDASTRPASQQLHWCTWYL